MHDGGGVMYLRNSVDGIGRVGDFEGGYWFVMGAEECRM
jgi:hypothetical protein